MMHSDSLYSLKFSINYTGTQLKLRIWSRCLWCNNLGTFITII